MCQRGMHPQYTLVDSIALIVVTVRITLSRYKYTPLEFIFSCKIGSSNIQPPSQCLTVLLPFFYFKQKSSCESVLRDLIELAK